jgi:biopolymer transport protein TolR
MSGSSWGGAGDDELIGGVNVTPIVDVCLTLLVVFIVTASQVVNRSMPVNLPKAASAESAPPSILNVAIARNGDVFINGAPARLADIPREVEAARARAASTGVEAQLAGFVSADVDAPYGKFAEAVDQLRIAGVNDIALDTQPPTTDPVTPRP